MAVLLNLSNLETFALVLIAAVPSPKTAYILAEEYNFEPELMAGHIALTTVIGVVTIFGLILFASSVDPTLLRHLQARLRLICHRQSIWVRECPKLRESLIYFIY